MSSSHRSRHRLRMWLMALPLVVMALAPTTAVAQTPSAPDSFSTQVAGTGMLIEISAPAALPLDVLAGVAYAQVGVNSQPRVQSTAAPLFVPLFDAFGLLGGTSGVLSVIVRLAPGLVVGAPSLIGLEPLPVDPTLVPVDPVADAVGSLSLPDPPQLGCTSNFPDEPRHAECGGGAQDFFGYRVGAGSASTTSSGTIGDPSSLRSRSDARTTGITPGAFAPLAPISVRAVAATSESLVVDGRITAVSSAGASGIDVAGLLGIESVQASFSGALGGMAETLDEQFECNITGVSAGGEEIELGADAITLGGTDTDPGLEAVGGLLNDVVGAIGGEVGPADFGTVTITPNPVPVTKVSEDGTSLERRFGCLEVRYRNATSGSDVRLTFGNVAVSMAAFDDVPFDGGPTTPDSEQNPTVAPADPGDSFGSGGGLGPVETPDESTAPELALPSAPVPGSRAPDPSTASFLQTASLPGWGIDGAWLAPFTLLALAMPFLVKSRRLTFSTDRS